jgi:hypothetical protein
LIADRAIQKAAGQRESVVFQEPISRPLRLHRLLLFTERWRVSVPETAGLVPG